MNLTNITYGSYNFQTSGGPVPFLSIQQEYKRRGDNTKLGSRYTASIQGELNRVPSGIAGITNLVDMMNVLDTAFSTDCQEFKITCDGNTLLQQYPRVKNISFSPTNDNWTQSIDYNIELEWEGQLLDGRAIDAVTESWDFQINEQATPYEWNLSGGLDNNMHLFSLTHEISAKGTKICTGSLEPWQHARDYVLANLGYESQFIENSGVFNLNASAFSGWNHSRVQRIDQTDGNFQVTETWLVANIGFQNNCGAGIEDFTVNVAYDLQNGLHTASLNGSIEGLEHKSYGSNPNDYDIITTKYENASGFWNCVKPKLAGRASLAAGVNINPVALNYSIGHNPTRGIITYNYTFDSRPCNYIAGALFEDIDVTDSLPTDVFAQIAILGRPWGPILQNINTVTASTRTVNITASMGPATGCSSIINDINNKPNVTGLLCALQSDLSGENIQLFKSVDNESWKPKTGVYSRTVTWTYVPCSGTPPNSSFC